MNGDHLGRSVKDPIEDLCKQLRRVSAIERGLGVLRWDQEVVMPPQGTPARAEERSHLAALAHRAWTSDEMGSAIAAAEDEASSVEDRALVREAGRKHRRRTRVPDEIVEELAEATSKAHSRWLEAKQSGDFEPFAPALETIVDLRRRYADAIDPGRDPYEVLFEDHEPWLGWEHARRELDRLAERVPKLVDDAPPPKEQPDLRGRWPVDTQRGLMRGLLDELGYDFERGRLDESEHPFSTGNPFDARITTNLDAEDLLGGLTSTVHEFGHALYTQNLPDEHLGTPLGQSRNLVVHEANARFWENHVARSRGFWQRWSPRLEEAFGTSLDPERAWLAANEVRPSLIRVDADELTYHLHIVLRTEIERRLIHEDLSVHEAPAYWEERSQELLGVRPEDDAEGILQDVHWSHGSIGYFPTYSLGSMLAAQLARGMRGSIGDLGTAVGTGRFEPIRGWLEANVHRHGQRFTTSNLIEHATGERLSADAFLSYAEEKYARVWQQAT